MLIFANIITTASSLFRV